MLVAPTASYGMVNSPDESVVVAVLRLASRLLSVTTASSTLRSTVVGDGAVQEPRGRLDGVVAHLELREVVRFAPLALPPGAGHRERPDERRAAPPRWPPPLAATCDGTGPPTRTAASRPGRAPATGSGAWPRPRDARTPPGYRQGGRRRGRTRRAAARRLRCSAAAAGPPAGRRRRASPRRRDTPGRAGSRRAGRPGSRGG